MAETGASNPWAWYATQWGRVFFDAPSKKSYEETAREGQLYAECWVTPGCTWGMYLDWVRGGRRARTWPEINRAIAAPAPRPVTQPVPGAPTAPRPKPPTREAQVRDIQRRTSDAIDREAGIRELGIWETGLERERRIIDDIPEMTHEDMVERFGGAPLAGGFVDDGSRPRADPRVRIPSRWGRFGAILTAIELGRRAVEWLWPDEEPRTPREPRPGRPAPAPGVVVPPIVFDEPMPSVPEVQPRPARTPRTRPAVPALPEPGLIEAPVPVIPAPQLPPTAWPTIPPAYGRIALDALRWGALFRGLDRALDPRSTLAPGADPFVDPAPQPTPRPRCGACPPCTDVAQKRRRKKRRECLTRQPVTVWRCSP